MTARPVYTPGTSVPAQLRAVAETYADDAVMFRTENETDAAVIYSTIATGLRAVADEIDGVR